MKKVILTGATGFIGTALLEMLLKNNYYVYALCRKNSKNIKRISNLKNVEIIFADFDDLSSFPLINGVDFFYHLSWEGSRNSFDEQYKNIYRALNCLKIAAKLGVHNFLCTGSQAEYGETNQCITEETVLKPCTSYGSAKVATYYLMCNLAKQLGINIIWARLFSVYGIHDNPNSLIPTVMNSLHKLGYASLLTDGRHIWNYLHEVDAARALLLLNEKSYKGVINIASHCSKPLYKFIREISSNIKLGSKTCSVNLDVSVSKIDKILGLWELKNFSDEIKKIYSIYEARNG